MVANPITVPAIKGDEKMKVKITIKKEIIKNLILRAWFSATIFILGRVDKSLLIPIYTMRAALSSGHYPQYGKHIQDFSHLMISELTKTDGNEQMIH